MARGAHSTAEPGSGDAHDPLESEPWFRELPTERRAEFRALRRSELERGAELASAERRRALLEAGRMAGVFAAGDFVAPGRDPQSLVLAIVLGSGLGFAFGRLEAGRLSSGAGGLVAFIAFEWANRGGLSALHMLLFFPIGCACAYLGWLREERHTG